MLYNNRNYSYVTDSWVLFLWLPQY